MRACSSEAGDMSGRVGWFSKVVFDKGEKWMFWIANAGDRQSGSEGVGVIFTGVECSFWMMFLLGGGFDGR